jgi:hypothetical protein
MESDLSSGDALSELVLLVVNGRGRRYLLLKVWGEKVK